MELCNSTKILLLETKISLLETIIKELQIREAAANQTAEISDKFSKVLHSVQKEYPNHVLDNKFNLIERNTITKTTEKEE